MSANRRRLRAANILLALCCLGLSVLIYRQIERALSAPPPPEARPQVSLAAIKRAETRAAADDVFHPPPIAAYEEIVARPLFHSTRRPIAVRENGRRARAADDTPLHLTGIVTEGGETAAFFRVKGASRMVRVSLGGTVEGWTVEAIDGDSVVVAKKGKRARLTTTAAGSLSQPVSELSREKSRSPSKKHERLRRKQHENKD